MHVGFWIALGVARAILGGSMRGVDGTSTKAPVSHEARTGRYSRFVLAFHIAAFGVMYLGMANAVLPNRVPSLFAGQRVVGTIVMAAGAALIIAAFAHFQSWRFRAKIDRGHQLATTGPFHVLRHPIYAGLDLLALGTAIWAPTTILWLAFVLMAIGSDLRARVEETLLQQTFGSVYERYRRRTRRFVPGIY